MKKKYDVIIIGGGPSGSTAATTLTQKGVDCVVFEKEHFPRPHVGESLLPFCYHLLEDLGVLEEVRANSFPKPGARFLNSTGDQYSNYCFTHYIDGPSAISAHVDRATYDKILLDNSKRTGATVMEGTRVKKVTFTDDGVVVDVHQEGEDRTYEADFLLDASGQHSFLGRRTKKKEKMENLDRTAMSAHWKGGKLLGGLAEGIQQIIHLGGDKQGWIWAIPLTDGRLSLGVVLNSAYFREQKERFGNDPNWYAELYKEELMQSPFVQQLIGEAELGGPVNLNGDYSYKVTEKYGDRFALVGDAGTFIDPIFATGVYLAMKSSLLVAGTLGDHFGKPELHDKLEETYGKIAGAYRLIERLIRNYYNPTTLNFHEFDHQYEKTDSAIALMHHILAGDFFDKYDHYDGFLTKLENTKTFERYKNLVYDRIELEQMTCATTRHKPAEMVPA